MKKRRLDSPSWLSYDSQGCLYPDGFDKIVPFNLSFYFAKPLRTFQTIGNCHMENYAHFRSTTVNLFSEPTILEILHKEFKFSTLSLYADKVYTT